MTANAANTTAATTSQHRTRLPTPIRQVRQFNQVQNQNSTSGLVGKFQNTHTSMPRQPLNGANTSNVNTTGMSGYGMSAGMKVGRQQPTGSSNLDPRTGRLRGR